MTKHMSPRRRGARHTRLLSGLAAGAVSAALVVTVVIASQATATAARTAVRPGPIRFSHAVVVDEQRPGFEPDVKVDCQRGHLLERPVRLLHDDRASSGPHATAATPTSRPRDGRPGQARHLRGRRRHRPVPRPAQRALLLGPPGPDEHLQQRQHRRRADLDDELRRCPQHPRRPDVVRRQRAVSPGGNLILYQDYDVVERLASQREQRWSRPSRTTGRISCPWSTAPRPATASGAAIQDCVTDNEGISGNQVVDPGDGQRVHRPHVGRGVEQRSRRPRVGGEDQARARRRPPPGRRARNLDGPLCPGSETASDGSNTCVDKNGNPEEIAGENFATIARDSAGYLYVTLHRRPDRSHGSSSDPTSADRPRPSRSTSSTR